MSAGDGALLLPPDIVEAETGGNLCGRLRQMHILQACFFAASSLKAMHRHDHLRLFRAGDCIRQICTTFDSLAASEWPLGLPAGSIL